MSNRRCRALRAAFTKRFGRPPEKASPGRRSEWRIVKKQYLRQRRAA